MTCQNCQLFDPKTSTCHATPPVVQPANPGELAVFPRVTAETWCARHEIVRRGSGFPHNQPK